jgi:hypothetical protein
VSDVKRWALAMLVAQTWWLGCSHECSFANCNDGCCQNGVCFLGSQVKGGRDCTTFPSGTGGGSAGGNTRTGGGSVGPAPCITKGSSCTPSGMPCCAEVLDSSTGVACHQGRCELCVDKNSRCSPTLPCCDGACTSGYCSGNCGIVQDACNAQNTCCADFGTYGSVCRNERCTFCKNPGAECETTADCCPGLECKTRPGFSTVTTCQ